MVGGDSATARGASVAGGLPSHGMRLADSAQASTVLADTGLAALVTAIMVAGTFGASVGQVPPREPRPTLFATPAFSLPGKVKV